MKTVHFGRKVYTFGHGESLLKSVSITEKPLLGETETSFKTRLLARYYSDEGTIEIVIKNGLPSYAIVTIL